MKLIIIFGPQAVGKMTIGKELEKITDLKLFHNHMSIDLVNSFISYSTKDGKRIVNMVREEIFKSFSKQNEEGMIFTYIWNFDIKDDWNEIENIKNIFKKNGGDVYLIELETDVEERLKRNKTELRLKEKPNKRDLKWSENDLLNSHQTKRLNSFEGEIKENSYLRINNTELSPEMVAQKIKDFIYKI